MTRPVVLVFCFLVLSIPSNNSETEVDCSLNTQYIPLLPISVDIWIIAKHLQSSFSTMSYKICIFALDLFYFYYWVSLQAYNLSAYIAHQFIQSLKLQVERQY